jgi:hypothetical protein
MSPDTNVTITQIDTETNVSVITISSSKSMFILHKFHSDTNDINVIVTQILSLQMSPWHKSHSHQGFGGKNVTLP